MLNKIEIDLLREKVSSSQKEIQDVGDGVSNEVIAALLELPIVLWEIDINGVFTMSVGSGLRALDLKPGQVVGLNVFDLYSATPEALAPIRLGLSGVENKALTHIGDAVWENRYFPRLKDGKTLGLYGLSMDVTRQHAAEKQSRKADLKWRILAENAPDIITIIDREHNISFINHAKHAALRDGKSQVYDHFDSACHDTARTAIEACFAGIEKQSYVSTVTIGDVTRWFENRLSPIEQDGIITGVILISADVTARKAMEVSARALQAQSIQAQKLESLGMLAGGIAHDFNNLLVSMMGYAELARLQLPTGHASHPSLDGIEAAATRAAELCDQMLAYAGKGSFEMRRVDLSRLTADFAHLLSVSLGRNLTLERDLPEDLWLVEADGAQLQQVVMNLITNAADAMEGADGVVTVRTGCGRFDAEALRKFPLVQPLEPGEYVFLDVSDTGCGMDNETLQKMFDPFFSTKTTGRGLGLASTMAIVRGHRGGLSTLSSPGEGTTIRLFLPRSGDQGKPTFVAAKARERKTSSLGAGRTILLGDDEPNVLNVATAMLQHLGFKVLAVRNGKEALDAYPLHPEIAAVMLDVTMPVMRGDAAAEALRSLYPDVKIILTSGYHDDASQHPGMLILPKPYRIADMHAVLAKLLADDSVSG